MKDKKIKGNQFDMKVIKQLTIGELRAYIQEREHFHQNSHSILSSEIRRLSREISKQNS